MPYIAIRQDGRIVKHKHSNMVGSCLHMKYCWTQMCSHCCLDDAAFLAALACPPLSSSPSQPCPQPQVNMSSCAACMA